MTYDEVIKKIKIRQKFGIKPGLERINKFLSLISNPQKNLKFIHVAGTNGKGSVCSMISKILASSGYKTGLFISPEVVNFRERIQLNNKMISEKELVDIFDKIEPYLNKLDSEAEYLTEFELVTALAFVYFSKCKCDIVILETGLGGRLDATNVIEKPLASVVTSLSYDHVNILGNTIEKIAKEKAGIIKPEGITVLSKQSFKEAIKVVEDASKELKNEFIYADIKNVSILDSSIKGSTFSVNSEEYFVSLPGLHQVSNAHTALLVVNVLKKYGFFAENSAVKTVLKNMKFPARFEVLKSIPTVILDGAHNFDGMLKLKENINMYLKGKKLIGIMGMLKDKKYEKSISLILNSFEKIFMVPINNDRSLQLKDIEKLSNNLSSKIIPTSTADLAVKNSLAILQNSDALVTFGSLYLASEIRPLLIKI